MAVPSPFFPSCVSSAPRSAWVKTFSTLTQIIPQNLASAPSPSSCSTTRLGSTQERQICWSAKGFPLEHNIGIFLAFWNTPIVLWVSRRELFRLWKRKKGFPYIREGSCFCKNTDENLPSEREEFHCPGAGGQYLRWEENKYFPLFQACPYIKDVLVPDSLSCMTLSSER